MASLEHVGSVAAVLAALVAMLYVVGAVVIGVRLGLRDLPSSAVVAQLPREFLLSTGLNVVLPAPAVAAALYASVALAVGRSRARVARRSAAVALLVAVASAGYYIWKDPFPAKICSPAGDATAIGDFIGETGDHVYIGELRDSAGRRRIASVPVARVGEVLIGGGAHQEPCAASQP